MDGFLRDTLESIVAESAVRIWNGVPPPVGKLGKKSLETAMAHEKQETDLQARLPPQSRGRSREQK